MPQMRDSPFDDYSSSPSSSSPRRDASASDALLQAPAAGHAGEEVQGTGSQLCAWHGRPAIRQNSVPDNSAMDTWQPLQLQSARQKARSAFWRPFSRATLKAHFMCFIFTWIAAFSINHLLFLGFTIVMTQQCSRSYADMDQQNAHARSGKNGAVSMACVSLLALQGLHYVVSGLLDCVLVVLLLIRFSTEAPTANEIRFSKRLVLAVHEGQVRIAACFADADRNGLVHPSVRLVLVSTDVSDALPGEEHASQGRPLSLTDLSVVLSADEKARLAFGLPGLAYHVLDAHSPLATISPVRMARCHMEIIALFHAVDAVTGKHVEARHGYSAADIVLDDACGTRSDTACRQPDGAVAVDYSCFDESPRRTTTIVNVLGRVQKALAEHQAAALKAVLQNGKHGSNLDLLQSPRRGSRAMSSRKLTSPPQDGELTPEPIASQLSLPSDSLTEVLISCDFSDIDDSDVRARFRCIPEARRRGRAAAGAASDEDAVASAVRADLLNPQLCNADLTFAEVTQHLLGADTMVCVSPQKEADEVAVASSLPPPSAHSTEALVRLRSRASLTSMASASLSRAMEAGYGNVGPGAAGTADGVLVANGVAVPVELPAGIVTAPAGKAGVPDMRARIADFCATVACDNSTGHAMRDEALSIRGLIQTTRAVERAVPR